MPTTEDKRGPRERAYDEQLSGKIAELLALAEAAGVPLFLYAPLDGDTACTSLVCSVDLQTEPTLRDMYLVARHHYTAVGPIAATSVQLWLDGLDESTRQSYEARCAKISGGLA